jgi:hypothetical protein
MSLLKNISQLPQIEPVSKIKTAPPVANSLIKEFTTARPNIQTILKKSDASDAGANDVIDKARAGDDVSFSLMRNTINSDGSVTGSDVTDYIERAEELNDEVDTVPFGLETDDGQIVKVYVNAEQADKFEEAMKNMLGMEDDIEEAINRLTTEFDIVDVVWPTTDDADGNAVADPDADLSIDDTSNLEDDDFGPDNYDVVASADDKKDSPDEDDEIAQAGKDDEKEKGDGDDEDDAETTDDDESDDEEDSEKDDDEDELDADGNPVKKKKKKGKKKKAQPAEPADDEDKPKQESLSPVKNNQENKMTIGSTFLSRVMQEAAPVDRDGVKDGFDIPLDSQSRALASKLKLPFAKRLVAFHHMVGVPGRYLNTDDVEAGISGAADMLRKQVSVRRAFEKFYSALATAKGFTIPDVVKEASTEDKVEAFEKGSSKLKRGDAVQKLLETIMVKLGLPESLVVAGGPSGVGTALSRCAKLIESDSNLQSLMRLLASRMGVKSSDTMNEAANLGTTSYAAAVADLLESIGIPDTVFDGGRAGAVKNALTQKSRSLRNLNQIIGMMNRVKSLIDTSSTQAPAATSPGATPAPTGTQPTAATT